MAAKALAATRAAGIKPDMAYVPRPSATPAEISESTQVGAVAPLYTGDPAPMGLADYGLSLGPDLYVTNSGSDTVSVFDGENETLMGSITVGSNPSGIAYDTVNGEVFVTNTDSGTVSVISSTLDTVLTTITVGSYPENIAYDSGNGDVYVSNLLSNDVSVIDTATYSVAATVSVGTGPLGVVYDSANGMVYVASQDSGTVSVISGTAVVHTISVGGDLEGIAFDSANGEVYVSNYLGDTVSAISGSTNSVLATITVGSEPRRVGYDSGNGEVYVSNYAGDNVTVISGVTNSVIGWIPVGTQPLGFAYDPTTQEMYVANAATNNMSIISGATNKVVSNPGVGIDPDDIAYGGGASVLNTTSLQGNLDANSTGIQGEDLYQALPDGFSIQMNAVLTNITLLGKSGYQFWAQDIVTYFPASDYLILVTNVWNFSAPGATMTSNSIASHGPYGHSNYASLGFYYANYTVPYAVTYPFNVTLSMTSSVYDGYYNEVSFSASVVSPTSAFTPVEESDYDNVVFNSPPGAMLSQPSNFTASGTGYNNVGLLDDFELVVCGPGGGTQVDLSSADATLALSYLNTAENATWSSIPSAYNYGSDTGETSTGANVAWSDSWRNSPSGLAPYATMTTGPSILSSLWGSAAPEGAFPAVFSVSPANAFLFFNYTGTTSFVGPFVSEFVYAPTMETTTFYLMNGTYDLHIELADYEYILTSFKISGAPSAFNFNLNYTPGLGVYTPLWAFSNGEVGALAKSGGGTPSNPYVLFNNQLAPLSSDFGLYNDYSFPVFPGVFLKGTTASVDLNNSSSFETYTNDFQPQPGLTLPTTNELQFWFWDVSGVALVNDTNITGWFGLQNYYPLTYNSFNVIFYASEHNLVADNAFFTESEGLLMYANGTTYGPYFSSGGHNTVWGNDFVQVSPPMGCPGPGTCLPLYPYNSGLGLELGEGSDLIYNNLLATPTTAWELPLNLYTELPTTWINNVWNISTEPASFSQTVPGFPTIALTGSIVGGSTQGGNSWWDYGLTHNWANDADNPLGTFPYDENAPSLIDPAMGYGSPIPGYPCPTFYCATYIYPGGDYLPLATIASTMTLGPQGVVGNSPWGVVLSCQPAHSGGGGPAHSGGGGPAHSGGGGPCSGDPDPPGGSGGGDPPKLILADFTTNASLVHLVLPVGAYNWTPVASPGYTTSSGGSFVVTATEPVTLTVPYATPTTSDFTFSEGGLPSGLTWQVTVGGVAKSLTTDGGVDTLAFSGAYGTFSYTIASVSGWYQSTLPYSGSVTGGAVSEPTLMYTRTTYSVAFFEKGLPSTLIWQVSVGGNSKSLTTDGGTDSLTWTGLPNGTYSYSITGNAGWSQSTLAYSGTVTVNGATVDEPTLTYTPVTYTALLYESGLPSGQTWHVTIDGIAMSLTTNGGTDLLTWTGLANGTYAYTITGNPGWHQSTLPYSGSVVVSGGTNSISGSGIGYSATLAYSQVTYSVTFSESGLPSGRTWQVTVGGLAKSLTTNGGTDSLTWSGLANATYAYSITPNAGWHQTTLAYSGSVVVNGASISEPTLVYGSVTYSVTFSETGLPAGLTWKLTVNGVSKSLTTNGILDWLTWTGLANGTYSYSVVDNPGWHQLSVPYSGAFTVNGASLVALLIYYQVTYSVTFSESGLAAGLTWTITFDGVTKSLKTDGHTDSLTWTGLPNGTYAYSIKAISGWTQSTLPATGSVTVKGASVSEPTLKYTA